MTSFVLMALIFIVIGIGFLVVNLTLGKLIRPNRPSAEKGTVYECGEPAAGSSWIQFDLRFYVVALLFVIFDVEMAFFFPWATVFGSSNRLADAQVSDAEKVSIQQSLGAPSDTLGNIDPEAAKTLATLALVDVFLFFGILMVGFAYLWKRGDLEWIRSTSALGEAKPVATE